METSLKHVDLNGVETFFRNICLVIKEHKEMEKARAELHKQIQKIKEAPKKWIFEEEVEGLHKKVSKVLDTEKKLLGYKDDTELINKLNAKIKSLEEQFAKMKAERNEALFENRGKINEVHTSMRNIKSKVHTFIKAKEERDERLKELEKRVKKVAEN